MFTKHLYIHCANIASDSTNKAELKKLLGKQKQLARIIFNQDRFTHAYPLLKGTLMEICKSPCMFLFI